MKWKVIHQGFFHLWNLNVKQNIESAYAYNIRCHTPKEVEYCIEQLKKVFLTDNVIGTLLIQGVSASNPLLVRWACSITSQIIIGTGKYSNQDKIMDFTEVFGEFQDEPPSLWNQVKQPLETLPPKSYPKNDPESEISIIHSKINYHVIQTEP